MGYSPWGHKESDITERLHFLSFFTICKYIYVFSEKLFLRSVNSGWYLNYSIFPGLSVSLFYYTGFLQLI